jgi:hypothetical protein
MIPILVVPHHGLPEDTSPGIIVPDQVLPIKPPLPLETLRLWYLESLTDVAGGYALRLAMHELAVVSLRVWLSRKMPRSTKS